MQTVSKSKSKQQGHPARKPRHVRRQEQKQRFLQPDATEQAVQELNRRMRAHIHEAQPGDGLVVGPLKIAAEHLVSQLQAEHNLPGEDQKAMIVAYLVGAWGEIAHAFPEIPALPSYGEWRERSRAAVLAAPPSGE